MVEKSSKSNTAVIVDETFFLLISYVPYKASETTTAFDFNAICMNIEVVFVTDERPLTLCCKPQCWFFQQYTSTFCSQRFWNSVTFAFKMLIRNLTLKTFICIQADFLPRDKDISINVWDRLCDNMPEIWRVPLLLRKNCLPHPFISMLNCYSFNYLSIH